MTIYLLNLLKIIVETVLSDTVSYLIQYFI
jgi:hypothetical protein